MIIKILVLKGVDIEGCGIIEVALLSVSNLNSSSSASSPCKIKIYIPLSHSPQTSNLNSSYSSSHLISLLPWRPLSPTPPSPSSSSSSFFSRPSPLQGQLRQQCPPTISYPHQTPPSNSNVNSSASFPKGFPFPPPRLPRDTTPSFTPPTATEFWVHCFFFPFCFLVDY